MNHILRLSATVMRRNLPDCRLQNEKPLDETYQKSSM